MRWKSVAWAGCLVPVLAGCGMSRHVPCLTPARADTGPSQTRRGIERDQRRAAGDAWQVVLAGHPHRTFSAEFRDGFLDGYADYLERASDAHPPAVQPDSAGNPVPVCDYYLGFGYGCEVATGSRRSAGTHGPVRVNPPASPFQTAVEPGPRPRPVSGNDSDPKPKKPNPKPGIEPLKPPEGTVPPLPKPELPVIRPFNPALSDDLKIAPLTPPSDPDRLPVSDPTLPTPGAPPGGPLTPPESSKAPARPWFLEPLPAGPFPVTPTGASAPQK